MTSGLQRSSNETEGADPFADPRWFPERFDDRTGELSFVLTDRDALAGQAFLDARWSRLGAERKRVGAAALIPRLPVDTPRTNFLWHTGFCCSTLLAKALDAPQRNLSLCEPQILVEVADAKRMGLLAHGGAYTKLPQLVFHLLTRTIDSDASTTLKPAPAANFLLHEAAQQTSGPMLFLFSDCRSFLISLIGMGEEGRKYARRMLLAVLGDGHPQSYWPVPQIMSLSDLEAAALVWHMQMAEFLREWPLLGTRARSLDCDAFLESPVEVLNLLDEFFSLGLGSEHAKHVTEGPLFRRNAKNPQSAFDASARREQHRQIALQMGTELDRIVARSYELCPGTPRGAPLPNPLVTADKSYVP